MSGPPYFARLLDLDSLERVRSEFRRIEVDKGGIPIMASKALMRLILLEHIPTPAANIIKQEVLARGGDLATPWSAAGFDAPYVDAILIGNLTTLRSTVSKLYRQFTFDLPQIADAIQAVLVHTTPGYLPVATRASRQGIVVEETLEDLMGGRIPLQKGSHRATGVPALVPLPDHTWRFGELTYLMAGLTLTGSADSAPSNRARIRQAAASGAHILALSPAASPAGQPAPVGHAAAQYDRFLALVREVRQEFPALLVAVETASAHLAGEAVQAGAQMLLTDSLTGDAGDGAGLVQVAVTHGLPVILRHTAPLPAGADPLHSVSRFFWDSLNEAVRAGLHAEQVILDPGPGYGKSPEQDRALTRRLRELTSFGRPILYAPSSGLRAGGNAGSEAAAVTLAIAGGANIIRSADIAALLPSVQLTDLLVRPDSGPQEA